MSEWGRFKLKANNEKQSEEKGEYRIQSGLQWIG